METLWINIQYMFYLETVEASPVSPYCNLLSAMFLMEDLFPDPINSNKVGILCQFITVVVIWAYIKSSID